MTPDDTYDRFLSHTGRDLHESAIRRMGTVVARQTDVVSFAPGYPDPALFPWPELREIAADVLQGRDSSVLQYGPTRGYAPLLDAVLDLLHARGIHTSLEQLVVTGGSQQGIDLTARLLINPGDVVLVELPTFTGAIAAFRNARADLVGIPQQDDGIDLDALDATWARLARAGRTAKLLYVIPNFQNPTGVLLSRSKRTRLIEWADRRDVLILEDDPYGSLFFDDRASAHDTRPIRADDTAGRVIYLSSFSKTLAPGLRVGWAVAPPTLADRIETAKQSVDLTSGALDQRMAYEAIRRGVIDRIAPALRASYRMKRDLMEAAIHREAQGRLRWLSPKGGFFIWATLPEGLTDQVLLARALDSGVVFVTGSAFYVDGQGHEKIRLSFSQPAPEHIEEGIRRLGPLLRGESAPATAASS